jgi:hypothetical protein
MAGFTAPAAIGRCRIGAGRPAGLGPRLVSEEEWRPKRPGAGNVAVLESGRHASGSYAVIDAVCPEKFDRVAHALRAARLAGMNGAVETRLAGLAESRSEPWTRSTGGRFVAVD